MSKGRPESEVHRSGNNRKKSFYVSACVVMKYGRFKRIISDRNGNGLRVPPLPSLSEIRKIIVINIL